MSRTVYFNLPGEAVVLEVVNAEIRAPQNHEVQMRVKAVGITRDEV